MNVAIVFKWAYNTDDALVEKDGTVAWRHAKCAASDDDAAAVVFARDIVNSSGGKLISATIGDGDATWSLARGAGSVASVGEFASSPDDAATASLLAYALKKEGEADVVIMGDMREHAGVAGALGGLLGIPALIDIHDVAVDPNNPGQLIVRRKTLAGIQTFRVKPPVLIAIRAERSETQAPSAKQLLAARKLPVERFEVENGQSFSSSASVVGQRAPKARIARMFEGDNAARDLIAALRADGVLK
jgi:electron transfer flavoprotein alpha/beta subunit